MMMVIACMLGDEAQLVCIYVVVIKILNVAITVRSLIQPRFATMAFITTAEKRPSASILQFYVVALLLTNSCGSTAYCISSI